MNPIIKAALAHVKKFKIVRSMAGRLRVNIVGARMYPEIARRFSAALEETLARQKGVSSASFCPITGNLLITYDCATTGEAELLKWLEAASDAVFDSLCDPELEKLSDAQIVKKIRSRLSKIK